MVRTRCSSAPLRSFSGRRDLELAVAFDFSTRRISAVLTLPGLYDSGSGFTISRDGTWLVYPQRDVARSEIMLMAVDR